MAERVEIFEVGPRDGLQNEPRQIATRDKVALIDRLSGAGFRRIEVTSFVSPKYVPQMADAADVMARMTRSPGVSYAALTPNLKGYTAAAAAGCDEVAVFASASEGFSQANINCSIADSLKRFEPVLAAAKSDGVSVRGYLSCVIECPFDGATDPKTVADLAADLLDMGCYEISLGDTIGKGTPGSVAALLDTVCEQVPAQNLAGHFHDTGGRALGNVDAALAFGVRVFDAAIGGLGGCPYAPGAPGNVATETLANHLCDLGYVTGLDMAVLQDAARMAQSMRSQHV